MREHRFGVVMHKRTVGKLGWGAWVSPSLGATPAPEIRPSGTGGVHRAFGITHKINWCDVHVWRYGMLP